MIVRPPSGRSFYALEKKSGWLGEKTRMQLSQIVACVLVVRIPFRLQVLESSQCSLISERRIRLQMEELH